MYTFSGSGDLTEKIRRRLEELQEKVSAIRRIQNCTNTAMAVPSAMYEAPKPSLVANSACAVVHSREVEPELPSPSGDEVWVKIRDITLQNSDKAIIEQGLELTDLHINGAQ